MAKSLNDLIQEYKENYKSWGAKKKAEFEYKLWSVYLMEAGPGHHGSRRDWFIKNLPESKINHIESRLNILSVNTWADPLWALLDSGYSHTDAVQFLRDARNLSRENKITPKEALGIILSKESSDPNLRGKLGAQEKTSEASKDESQTIKTKSLISNISNLIQVYAGESFSTDLDEHQSTEMKLAMDELIAITREAVAGFRKRVSYIRVNVNREARKQKTTRQDFRRACEVLNVPYVYGNPVDLKFCRKIKLKRASSLHPDKNGGSHAAQSEYQAVIEAYDTLEQYMEGLKSSENGERAHHEKQ